MQIGADFGISGEYVTRLLDAYKIGLIASTSHGCHRPVSTACNDNMAMFDKTAMLAKMATLNEQTPHASPSVAKQALSAC